MGMSEVIGPRNISPGSSQGQAGQMVGDAIQLKADQEINRILTEQYDRGMKLLTENKDVLDAIAKCLIEEEKINGK